MRGKSLGIALGVIALFAFWPTLVWLGAQLTLLGDRWFATGGAITYTFPIALALSAVVLAVHGMLLNAELADSLEEQFAAGPVLPADVELPVPVGAMAAAAPVATAPRTVSSAPDGAETVELAVDGEAEEEQPKLGGKMAVRERPKTYQADGGDGSKKSKKVKKVGRQVKQRAGYKAKHTIIRAIRERIGLRF